MKDELCKAFCDQITVRKVPVGLAVSTAYTSADGDRIGFYIVGPDEQGQFRIEDDGMVIPVLEASGADFTSDTRQAAFAALLSEYEAIFDEGERTIRKAGLTKAQIPQAALDFAALLLRVQDMMLMTYEKVFSTFKEEVTLRLPSEAEQTHDKTPAKVRILNAAEELLSDGQPRQTRQLLNELLTKDIEVGGNNKILALSALLSRDKRFVPDRKVGWSLKALETARPESAATDSGLFSQHLDGPRP